MKSKKNKIKTFDHAFHWAFPFNIHTEVLIKPFCNENYITKMYGGQQLPQQKKKDSQRKKKDSLQNKKTQGKIKRQKKSHTKLGINSKLT